jgi:thiol-disulfide isomerase/thioredoxin
VCSILTIRFAAPALLLALGVLVSRGTAQQPAKPDAPPQQAPAPKPQGNTIPAIPANPNPPANPANAAVVERQELQKAIDDAENDRAALVHNLEGFLKKYPESSQRSQIYRAIVESSLQLRDFPRAMDYAERLVALKPDDASITLLSIQLLERYGDANGWRRAISYGSRLIEIVDRTPVSEKSPHVSQQDWENEKKHNKSSLYLLRGRLYQKTSDAANAQKDLQTSYDLVPNAAAAERLGELAELRKDQNAAIKEYARAFALTDGSNGTSSRFDLRKKIGNVWRQAHGSEDGLGDYLLASIDEVAASTAPPKTTRNSGRKNPYEFTLRKAPDGTPFAFADAKGKVVVLNFWATWCGPCREMEPYFERVASRFSAHKDVLFYQLNCDEDEALVAPYLEAEKPKTPVLFADGLETLLRVNSFPTMVILDRSGKIVFHKEGFDPDTIDKVLTEAVERCMQGEQNSLGDTTSAGH